MIGASRVLRNLKHAGGGGITLIDSVLSQGNASGTTSGAINTTGATFLVVGVVSFQAATAPTLTDSYSNTWTGLTARSDAVTRTRLFYSLAPSVGTGHTFTSSGGSSYSALSAAAFSGTISAADTENGASGTGTSQSTGSVTPAENGSLCIAMMGGGSLGMPDSTSINSGFTLLESAPNNGDSFGIALAYLVQPAAAAVNPQFSWTTSGLANACIGAFNP